MSTFILVGLLALGVLFNIMCIFNAGNDPMEKFYKNQKQSRKSK